MIGVILQIKKQRQICMNNKLKLSDTVNLISGEIKYSD
jgi:hypothetical protein